MPSLSVIREALKDTLDQLGISVHAGIVDTPTPPCIEIIPVTGSNASFNRGVVDLMVDLIVTTQGVDGQTQLDDLLTAPSDSIPALLHDHPTAGQSATEDTAEAGVTFTISDQGFSEYGASSDGNVRRWSAKYSVKVLAKGTV